MPWQRPIVAGQELALNAIQSPEFVTGVSGWIIRRNGSAEFNDVVMRGSLIVDGSVLFDADDALILEDDAGHPVIVLSRSPAGGTHNGHPYGPGIWTGWWEDPFTPDSVMQGTVGIYNSFIELDTDTDISTTTFDGLNEVGFLRQLYNEGTEVAQMTLRGGSNNAGLDPTSFINLNSKSVDGSILALIELHGNVETNADLEVGDDLTVIGDATVNGALSANSLTVTNNVDIDGVLSTNNDVYGSVAVAAGGGVWVFQSVSYPFTVEGAGTISCTVTPSTASTNVRGTAYTSLTTTGVNVGCLRDGATVNTTCSYHVHRNLS